MADEIDVKPGYSPDDVTALIETLRGMVELEEGELYTLRKGKLHHVVRRDEENGLRRIMVMEEAYDAAQIMARRLRGAMRGYRPDPALVISACVMHVLESRAPEEADATVMRYLQRLFTRAEPAPEADAAPPEGAERATGAAEAASGAPPPGPAGGKDRPARRAPTAP
ncbi:MAG: hypothetical protein IPK64_21915 [bacterium]|nr:hypothetical protein [bacterium]